MVQGVLIGQNGMGGRVGGGVVLQSTLIRVVNELLNSSESSLWNDSMNAFLWRDETMTH